MVKKTLKLYKNCVDCQLIYGLRVMVCSNCNKILTKVKKKPLSYNFYKDEKGKSIIGLRKV